MPNTDGMVESSPKNEVWCSPPVAVRPQQLPLLDDNLTWERHERFCDALLHASPEIDSATIRRYGLHGEKQYGIDIAARTLDGKTWAFQCRETKRFNKTDAENAIKKCSYSADRYFILTACNVGTQADDVCTQKGNWFIWDRDVLSEKVRQLPIESARRLVANHFGRVWCKAFLGIRGAASMLTHEEFFASLIEPSSPFHHGASLRGRDAELQRLKDWLKNGSSRVAVLSGVGGFGKSRLLLEFARTSSRSMMFLAPALEVDQDVLDEIPYTDLVVVVDDAHRRLSDVEKLLSFARTRQHSLRFVLSARPHGLVALRAIGNQNALTDLPLIELEPLNVEVTRALIEELLPQAPLDTVKRFAQFSDGNPLVAVLGCWTGQHRGLLPAQISLDDDVRAHFLQYYVEELRSGLSAHIAPEKFSELMATIALVQPLPIEDDSSIDALAEFLGEKNYQIRRHLNQLESRGVLKRWGGLVRIVPDLLADQFLAQHCVGHTGSSLGFVEAAMQHFGDRFVANIARNVAELDWKVSEKHGGDSNLMDAVWPKLHQQALDSRSHSLLDAIANLAFYQPQRALRLAEDVMRSVGPDAIKAPKNRGLRDGLANILRPVGHTFEYLPDVCDLLWSLGRDDERLTPQNPNHPLRQLIELAKFGPSKPIEFNSAVLERAEQWFEDDPAGAYAHTVLDVVDPLLQNFGVSTFSRAGGLELTPFAVSLSNVKDMRERALAVIRRCIEVGSLRMALRATESLENAIRRPNGPCGAETPQSMKDELPSQHRVVIEIIEGVLNGDPHALIRLRLRYVLKEFLSWWTGGEESERARILFDSIDESFEDRVYRALVGYPWSFELDSEKSSVQEQRAIFERFVDDVAREFVATYTDVGQASQFLSKAMTGVAVYPRGGNSGCLFNAIARENMVYAGELLRGLLRSDAALVKSYGHTILVPIRRQDPELFSKFADLALDGKGSPLTFAVAHVYAWEPWNGELNERDLSFVTYLLESSDSELKREGLKALGHLGQEHLDVATKFLALVSVEEEDEIVKEICDLWGVGRIPWENLSEPVASRILTWLEGVEQLDDHEIQEFLGRVGTRWPHHLVEMCIRRIQARPAMKARMADYRPLPFSGLSSRYLAVPDSEAKELLRRVRDAAVGHRTSMFWFAKLFADVARDHKGAAIEVVRERMTEGGEVLVDLVALLESFRSEFVFNNRDFVSEFLARGAESDEKTEQRVRQALGSVAESGVRTGAPGEPRSQDVLLRDRSVEARDHYQPHTPQYRFFDELVTTAEQNIRRTLQRDEELEGRHL